MGHPTVRIDIPTAVAILGPEEGATLAMPWLDGLNPAQLEAVTADDGPTLVVAGAGTGKTKTLACRVAHLIHRGVLSDRILLLTFTRRAAAEMIRRAERMAGQDLTGAVWGGTFHAVANRLLRIYGRALGLPDGFTVMDQGDAADLINLIRSEAGAAKDCRRFPKKDTLLAIYSRMVNAQEHLDDTLRVHFPWCRDDIDGIRAIFERYMARKREQGLIDYDDLLLFWSALCATPRVGDAVAERFDHILVDEYQDTNSVQAELLRGMRRRNGNIMVVGDDAQAIYSFRAATIRNILDFPKQFPGTRIVTLEQNYRSTQTILASANAVMAPARERYTKTLWSNRTSEQKPVFVTCLDEDEQGDAVCTRIIEHLEQGTPLMGQAVLFRASHHSARLEIELAHRNIPFHKFGGLKFVEAAHVKDVLALLRILENPHDELSWFRVLQLLEGVGPKTARRVIGALAIRRAVREVDAAEADLDADAAWEVTSDDDGVAPLATPLLALFAGPPAVPPAARDALVNLGAMLAQCSGVSLHVSPADRKRDGQAGRKPPPLATQIELIRRFYDPIFERIYDNPTIRIRDLEQLGQIASSYRSRRRFITDLTLDPPSATSDLAGPPFLEEDYLTLSTIHSAKGCEWAAVHIIHAADGMIPSDMAVADADGVEEERRLFYVAMTRARDHLYVYFPLRYYHARFAMGDGHGYAQRTRFVTDDVLPLFESRVARQAEALDAVQHPQGHSDPYARVSRLWR